MGAAESTPTTNGTNQEEEREQESGGASMGSLKTAAVASLAVVGVAALAISKMRSDNIESEENENHAMKMKSSYLANSSTNSQSGYESRHVSYPIDRALMSQGPYKMNTDGSCRPTPGDRLAKGPSGFGGILRDKRGGWVRGFTGFIENSDCLTIEIHGIHKGLLLLDKYGPEAEGSILESDSEPATTWITKELNRPNSMVITNCWDIIMECRSLVDKNDIKIICCSRDANKCADKLAKIALEKGKPYMEIKDVPCEVKEIVDRESSIMWQIN